MNLTRLHPRLLCGVNTFAGLYTISRREGAPLLTVVIRVTYCIWYMGVLEMGQTVQGIPGVYAYSKMLYGYIK